MTLLWLAVAVLVIAVVGLGAAVRDLNFRVSQLSAGPSVGDRWSELTLPEAAQQRFAQSRGRVLFVSATCLACRDLLDQMLASGEPKAEDLLIVGESNLPPAYMDLLDISVADLKGFGVRITPFTMEVEDGHIVNALASADPKEIGLDRAGKA